MDRHANALFVPALALSLAAIAVTAPGCKSPTEKAEGQVMYQLRNMRADLQHAPQLIDLTTEALNTATAWQNPNRAADIVTLQSRLDDLQDSAKRLSNQVIAAKADSDRFFREWAREANRASAGQRAEITDAMASRRNNRDIALSYLHNADTAYTSYVSQIEAIERALLTDSSPSSIEGVSPMVSNAITDGNKAKEYLLRLLDQVDSALAAN